MVTPFILDETDRSHKRRSGEEEMRLQTARAQSLARVAARLNARLSLEAVLNAVCEETAHALGAPASGVYLYDDREDVLRSMAVFGALAGSNDDLKVVPRSIYDTVVQHMGTVICIPDVQAAAPHLPDLLSYAPPGLRAFAAVSMFREGRLLGVLVVGKPPGADLFTAAELELLQGLADQAALAIANAQLFDEAARHLNRMRALRAIDLTITASLELHVTLAAILDQVVAHLEADATDILLLQARTETLEYAAACGFRTAALQHTRLHLGEGYAGRAALEQRVVHVPNLAEAADAFRRAPLMAEEGLVAYYGVPLVAKGERVGVLEIFYRAPVILEPERLDFLEAVATQAAIAIDNAAMFDNLRRSHAALRDAQTHLVRAARLTAVGELAAGVAHQIDNPLTTVIADAELLLKSIGADHPGYASAAAIFQAGWRAHRVVQRLLSFSRPDEGKYVLTDVNETIMEALDLVGAHLARDGVDLRVQLAPGLPLIPANRQQLEEVWINLLLNARDALVDSRPGVIVVTSGLAPDGDGMEVRISDNGRGISEADRPHLFTLFYTTKGQGRGNGIGLSVCQSIAQNHGGEVIFESQEGKGATFCVCLPRAQASPPA